MKPDDEDLKCEGCGDPATCFDCDGVPLCQSCYDCCLDEMINDEVTED